MVNSAEIDQVIYNIINNKNLNETRLNFLLKKNNIEFISKILKHKEKDKLIRYIKQHGWDFKSHFLYHVHNNSHFLYSLNFLNKNIEEFDSYKFSLNISCNSFSIEKFDKNIMKLEIFISSNNDKYLFEKYREFDKKRCERGLNFIFKNILPNEIIKHIISFI